MLSSASDAEDSFPLMRLPRELRDQIYRELLVPKERKLHNEEKEPTPERENEPLYRLEPAILRCSKQVHVETYRVLYEENTWIRFTLDAALLQQCDLPDGQCHFFTTNLESFPGPIALNVTVKPTNNTQQKYRLAENIIHLSDLTMYVCPMYMEFPDNVTGYHLRLHIDETFHKHNNDEEDLLDDFRDMRGFGEASVTGTASLSTGQELTMLLMKPHRNIDEMLERLELFQTRADDKAALMQIGEAKSLYYRGLLSGGLLERDATHFHWTDKLRLYYKRLSFFLDVVVCNIKLGQLDEFDYHTLMGCILKFAYPEAARKLSTCRELLNAGKGREALRTLVPALRMIRGEYRDDEEIDTIEARLVATGLVESPETREVAQESTFSLEHTE